MSGRRSGAADVDGNHGRRTEGDTATTVVVPGKGLQVDHGHLRTHGDLTHSTSDSHRDHLATVLVEGHQLNRVELLASPTVGLQNTRHGIRLRRETPRHGELLDLVRVDEQTHRVLTPECWCLHAPCVQDKETRAAADVLPLAGTFRDVLE